MTEPEMLDLLQYILRQLQKLDSKLLAGHIIQAGRHNGSVMADIERKKNELLKSMTEKESQKENQLDD